ncbi:tetratricopeptide repeat protein [Butyrivibrio sp. JL13D10]|uniref:tetratricopeptide repeat protein n=1 Tax=Butyrivibrio sp. JL13D10 TaxID=3236815 RepID=UPI0038B555A5
MSKVNMLDLPAEEFARKLDKRSKASATFFVVSILVFILIYFGTYISDMMVIFSDLDDNISKIHYIISALVRNLAGWVVIVGIIVILFRSAREVVWTQSIFVEQCDPRKYVDVADWRVKLNRHMYKNTYLGRYCFNYVSALGYLKEYEQAFARLDEISQKKLKPMRAIYYNFKRGNLYADLGKIDESKKCLESLDSLLASGKYKGMKLSSATRYRDNLEGIIALAEGNYNRAAEIYRKLLEKKEDRLNTIIYNHRLGMAEYNAGNYMDAYMALSKAYDQGKDTKLPIMAEVNEKYFELKDKVNSLFGKTIA